MQVMKAKRLLCLLFFLPACLQGATSTAGDVVNRASIGAAFHGFSADAAGMVRNAVGPTARFIEPLRLVARSDSATVTAGAATQLAADLLLDDGTVSHLPADEVSWAVDAALGAINSSGSLTAAQVTERVKVLVTASAEGLTAQVAVRIQPGASSSGPQVPASLAEGAFDVGAGWTKTPWYGAYFLTESNWMMHADHGWLYFQDLGDGSFWTWDETNEWTWTSKDVYPHLYRDKDSTWLYFMLSSLPARKYYNQSTKAMESAAP